MPQSRIRLGFAVLVATMLVSAAAAGQPLQTAVRDHSGEYAQADIEYGSRLYTSQCTTCHGPTGDAVTNVNLRSGLFRRASTDAELTRIITAGIPGTAMPPFKLDPPEVTGLIAFLRNMNGFDPGSVVPGDADRGRAMFEGKGRCVTCHRVNGRGSRVAPDLSDIGSLRGAGSLQRTLLDPSSQMMPINRPVRAVMRDGTIVTGRRVNEDTYSVQLVDDHERLRSLLKADLREFSVGTTSTMPSAQGTLSTNEIADVVTYLLTLKGR
jgi:putative heme-binding domain-containing protein